MPISNPYIFIFDYISNGDLLLFSITINLCNALVTATYINLVDNSVSGYVRSFTSSSITVSNSNPLAFSIGRMSKPVL